MQENKIADIFLSLATYFHFDSLSVTNTIQRLGGNFIPQPLLPTQECCSPNSLSLHLPWHSSLSSLAGFKDTRILTLFKQTNQKLFTQDFFAPLDSHFSFSSLLKLSSLKEVLHFLPVYFIQSSIKIILDCSFFFFDHTPQHVDLSSPKRDGTQAPWTWSLNHWTGREVSRWLFLLNCT